jgi:hypothetical protein
MTIQETASRILRRRFTSALLRRFGIDPKRYWLLMDLFGKLSERHEMLNQLGRDGVTLQTAGWMYFAMSALISIVMVMAGANLGSYFWMFMGLTALLLFAILMSETSNSLVNPVEGLVLAHQPIDGATYTAAKLTHLVRVIFYLVPGLNAVPAMAALLLKDAGWLYPIRHMTAALAIGMVVGLACCAVFGWLVRFVPPARLKTVGQWAEMVPFLVYAVAPYSRTLFGKLRIGKWLTATGPMQPYLLAAAGLALVTLGLFGIRSLSGDYLIRVSAMLHGRSHKRVRTGRSLVANIVARLFGGQPGRAGFEYVSRMMRRDWQFRRQLLAVIPMLIACIVPIANGVRISPFSGRFTAVHILPHAFGAVLFMISNFLAYGGDYKGIWIFQLAPSGALARFARGVWALLWLDMIVIPHVVLLPVLAWFWGLLDAFAFLAFSLALASLYLALELRLIDGVPFGKMPASARGLFLMPLMIAGGAAIAVSVALQYFLVFQSRAIVAGVTLGVAAGTYALTEASLRAFESSIRYNLGLVSAEIMPMFTEVDA